MAKMGNSQNWKFCESPGNHKLFPEPDPGPRRKRKECVAMVVDKSRTPNIKIIIDNIINYKLVSVNFEHTRKGNLAYSASIHACFCNADYFAFPVCCVILASSAVFPPCFCSDGLNLWLAFFLLLSVSPFDSRHLFLTLEY